MPESANRVIAAFFGVLLALAVIGLSVRFLTAPFVTDVLVRQSGGVEKSGLAEDLALETAQHVRGYVTGARTDALPPQVEGQSGFGTDEVSHLDDVADVFGLAGWATVLSALGAGGWLVFAGRTGRRGDLKRSLRWAGTTTLVATGLAALVALLDFDRFFSGFHALFFDAGTWQFPADSLLIRLFPEPFWAAAGALWAVLVVASGIVLLGVARAIPTDAQGARST